MKKNDFATFLVYVAMFGVAILVGLMAIRPIMEDFKTAFPVNPILLIFLGLIVGILLNAVILEVGHVLGAKVGKYEILNCTILGACFKKIDGKRKVVFAGFDGLTGETKVKPKDPKTSSLSAYILFPVLFLFAEFIIAMIIIVTCQTQEKENPSIAWLHIFMITILTVGGMLFIYDLFPAHIDSTTDGYLLTLLSKPANKEAYNHLLLVEAAAKEKKEIPEIPVYDDITDFTAELNLLTVYRHLTQGNPGEALPILENIFSAERNVSASMKANAKALYLATLLEAKDRTKGKKFYEELDDETKRYISGIPTMACLRAYMLIASFVELSDSETNYAIDKAEKRIKTCEPNHKEAEKSLLQYDVDLVREAHPSWTVYLLPWEEAEQNKEDSDKK